MSAELSLPGDLPLRHALPERRPGRCPAHIRRCSPHPAHLQQSVQYRLQNGKMGQLTASSSSLFTIRCVPQSVLTSSSRHPGNMALTVNMFNADKLMRVPQFAVCVEIEMIRLHPQPPNPVPHLGLQHLPHRV